MKTKGTAKGMTTSVFRMVRMPFLMSAALVDAMLSDSGKVRHHAQHTQKHRASKHGHAKHAAHRAKAA
jgi:hypothetical protein